MSVVYEWDDAKSAENLRKHGLSFEDAEIVFSGPYVSFEVDRFGYGEQRFVTIGLLKARSTSSRTHRAATAHELSR